MRHKVKKIQIGTDKDHRTALIRNLAMSLIIYEKIKTTQAKAKAVQPFVERLITIAKGKDKRSAIRTIESLLQHENSSKKIFEVLLEKYKDKNSGFTRITKLGYRSGDNAPVVQIEFV
ncbi:MAG: 50S ribosomal protein L17 [Candidatus Gracilibacteria bacterium]|jgi:ribosomal protein L17